MTRLEFIEKANQVHHGKYNYSHVDYKNNKTPVAILCPTHGEFLQRPDKHLQGQGCPKCRANHAHTTESFIAKAKAVHGDAYDYSLIQYVNAKTKVKIRCKTCGQIFEQEAGNHLKGKGCPNCRYQKAEQTLQNHYGVTNPMYSNEICDRMKDTVKEKYGADNIAKSDVYHAKLDTILQKRLQTLQENATFTISKPEELLYQMLCDTFGAEDICRQYASSDYPYACDFYIKSRHLYIELNASWTHGSHWYNEQSENDRQMVLVYKEKNKSEYYQNAIDVWTRRDVEKRMAAKQAELNYLVFWDNRLRDAILWIASGCPDGTDYVREYSWIPARTFEHPVSAPSQMTGSANNFSQIAKHYQWRVFYEKEFMLWHQNPERSGILLQMFLYYNRYYYDHKLPLQLTDFDILRSFTISGVHKGFTVFHSGAMMQVLQEYGIQSVYDPCAGWGERMLCCFDHHVSYFGVDINEKLKAGYEAMMWDFGIQEQQIVFGDSATYDLTGVGKKDAVITCPPYGKTEQYTESGAETLNHSEFLAWWKQVVQNSLTVHPKYFCFQINQKWKQEMTEIVKSAGFQLVAEYECFTKSSHFNREKCGVNKKREYESMMVLKHIEKSEKA